MKQNEFKSFLREEAEGFSGKSNNFVFSCDRNIITENDVVDSKGRNLKDCEKSKIHTSLLPQPLAGDLDNGKVFLCVLNPGFVNEDYFDESIVKHELMKQLKQEDPSMFWLKKEYENTGGGKYWRKKFDQQNKNFSLVESILKEYRKNKIMVHGVDITKEDVFMMLSKIVVDLELIPYHSEKGPKFQYKLDSAKKMMDYVHKELIPEGRNDRIICFLRSIKEWGVTEEEKRMDNVFCNEKKNSRVRNFTFNVELPLGKFIFNHLREITDDFTIYLG
ncbi:MAG: hypothetical protein IJZ25_00800 [Lachnospiraceae bacterium]|nr:hypothetical protein [Lachnospiraceae bacterium]MBQ8317124.1 hypothetical protein [Lachnospiraceae bacterium]